MKDTYTIAKT